MKPIAYTLVQGGVIFHYKFKELREFLKRGREHGDVGWLLLEKINGFVIYRGFGTIENPIKELFTISMQYNAALDEEFSIEKIMHPDEPWWANKDNLSLVILDFSEN